MNKATDTMFKPKLAVFCCENSGHMAAVLAGKLRLSYPEGIQLLKLPCSGKMDITYFLKALEKGADGVLLLACHKDNCKFLTGNIRAAQRTQHAQKLLKEIGIEDERASIAYVAANAGHQFIDIIQAMYDKLRELGPNPGKGRRT